MQVFGNASHAYEPPLLLELTAPGQIGGDLSPARRAEVVAVRGRHARAAGASGSPGTSSVYDIELWDEIQNVNVQPFPGAPFTIPRFQNIDRSRHTGVEVGADRAARQGHRAAARARRPAATRSARASPTRGRASSSSTTRRSATTTCPARPRTSSTPSCATTTPRASGSRPASRSSRTATSSTARTPRARRPTRWSTSAWATTTSRGTSSVFFEGAEPHRQATYVSAVVVDDANRRFFDPGDGRALLRRVAVEVEVMRAHDRWLRDRWRCCAVAAPARGGRASRSARALELTHAGQRPRGRTSPAPALAVGAGRRAARRVGRPGGPRQPRSTSRRMGDERRAGPREPAGPHRRVPPSAARGSRSGPAARSTSPGRPRSPSPRARSSRPTSAVALASTAAGPSSGPLRVNEDRPISHSFDGLAVARRRHRRCSPGSTAATAAPNAAHLRRARRRAGHARGRHPSRSATTPACAAASTWPPAPATRWRVALAQGLPRRHPRHGAGALARRRAHLRRRPRCVHDDGWKITACPHRGGAVGIDGRGPRVRELVHGGHARPARPATSPSRRTAGASGRASACTRPPRPFPTTRAWPWTAAGRAVDRLGGRRPRCAAASCCATPRRRDGR